MKKFFTKIKTVLATLWVAVISFSSKVMGQFTMVKEIKYQKEMASLYWPPPMQRMEILVNIATKITSLLLVAVTLVFWIVSFIKIRKIDDENLKKKKIKNAIIIISILVILIIILLLLPRFLKEYL